MTPEQNGIHFLAGFLLLLAIIALYFLPTFFAYRQHKANATAIMMLNLLTGWSGIGWLIALIWSLTKDRREWSPAPPPPQANLPEDSR
jgi:hypothetical protein